MSWKNEFQYLLDRKMLSRDELSYLFGQIKSIIDSENMKIQTENEKYKKALEDIYNYSFTMEISKGEYLLKNILQAKAEKALKALKGE